MQQLKIQKLIMARRLNPKALEAVMNTPEIFVGLCPILGIVPVSLPKLVQRNAKALVHYDAVVFIATKMDVLPDDILESEDKENTHLPEKEAVG